MVHFESDGGDGGGEEKTSLAPVTYLPGVTPARTPTRAAGSRAAPAGDAASHGDAGSDETADAVPEAEAAFDVAAERERAERTLLQRLRGRSLSTSEACAILAATDLDDDDAVDIIEKLVELGYIDEEKLADQIVHSHHERKGLGRAGVEAEMRRRKIDPAVMLDKLGEMPDDEVERAIELALKRVGQLERFDDKTVDRRLTGFLMRKGYSSSAVRVAVKEALASRGGSGRGKSTVRFS
jgi:regulatory protein